ncbi:MAG: ribonuclease [Pseudonocardiales bacterium]|nr:ribonuclease [Jatrophihabitantaceae bacterium]MCW2604644.1 ribonuclease [Pseudonocardiales bacterium]
MTVTEPTSQADGIAPPPDGMQLSAVGGYRAARGDLSVAIGTSIEAKLLERALTHRSYAYEHGGLPHNERLEFLGDAVLGIVITDALYRGFPELPEGKLAKLRASIVNMRSLADVARSIDGGGLGPYLRLGRGEETTGGRDKASILADTLEALLGAVYLEHGLAIAEQVIHRLFDPLMSAVAHRGAALDWKTSLQELTAALTLGAPDYVITSEGPDHDKSFTAAARVAGELFGTGEGRSKKEAEQSAAQLAWNLLSERAERTAAVVEAPDSE